MRVTVNGRRVDAAANRPWPALGNTYAAYGTDHGFLATVTRVRRGAYTVCVQVSSPNLVGGVTQWQPLKCARVRVTY